VDKYSESRQNNLTWEIFVVVTFLGGKKLFKFEFIFFKESLTNFALFFGCKFLENSTPKSLLSLDSVKLIMRS
jgi:hypothetical protein